MGIALPDPGTEYTTPKGTLIVTSWAVHAAMVTTGDETPAEPVVQMQLDGVVVHEGEGQQPATVLALCSATVAHDILHGIERSLMLLRNLADNQEGPTP